MDFPSTLIAFVIPTYYQKIPAFKLLAGLGHGPDSPLLDLIPARSICNLDKLFNLKAPPSSAHETMCPVLDSSLAIDFKFILSVFSRKDGESYSNKAIYVELIHVVCSEGIKYAP